MKPQEKPEENAEGEEGEGGEEGEEEVLQVAKTRKINREQFFKENLTQKVMLFIGFH